MSKKIFLASLFFLGMASAVHVRVLVIRGNYTSVGWSYVAQETYRRTKAACDTVSGIDIILTPEFAFAGTDGGTHYRPEVTFTWDDTWGFIPHPRDAGASEDVRTAAYLDSMRYIAIQETCHIFAATCGEVIGTTNYNTMPIFLPNGKLYRLRRKCAYGVNDPVRDTTIHCDSLYTKAGPRIAIMTTICYENGSGGIAPILDPVELPAPLWLLPHGTWSAAGTPNMTYRTQRWIWNSSPIDLSGVWRIPYDGWVRGDAILISADIFSTNWTAIRIDNYGDNIDPLAYEPLAQIWERPRFVVIDMNVPDVNDTFPVFHARKMVEPEFDQLTALPQISSGHVTIGGAKGNTIEIFNDEGQLVETLIPVDGNASWEGIYLDANPPGDYTIVSGAETAKVTLIR